MKALLMGLMLVATSSTLAAQSTPRDTAALLAEVERQNQAMEAAFAKGDLKAVAAFFTDDAIIRSAHAIGAKGRAEIDAYFAAIPHPKSWKLEVFGVSANGDAVYQTGRTTAQFGSPVRTNTFQMLFVWQRQPNGTLKIALNYYHVPEPGGPGSD